MPSISRSATRRLKMRRTVCRCLRGASRSVHRIWSITGLNRSNREDRGGGFLRGAGNAEASASRTVRRCTRYFFAKARTDRPSRRESLRMAAYISSLWSRATPTPRCSRATAASHPTTPGGAKTH